MFSNLELNDNFQFLKIILRFREELAHHGKIITCLILSTELCTLLVFNSPLHLLLDDHFDIVIPSRITVPAQKKVAHRSLKAEFYLGDKS